MPLHEGILWHSLLQGFTEHASLGAFFLILFPHALHVPLCVFGGEVGEVWGEEWEGIWETVRGVWRRGDCVLRGVQGGAWEGDRLLGLGEWAGHIQGEFLYLEMPLQVAFLWHTSLQDSPVHDSLVMFILMVPPQALHSDLGCEGV